jgi:eukaryotic-like serine/threonine-protein kinase
MRKIFTSPRGRLGVIFSIFLVIGRGSIASAQDAGKESRPIVSPDFDMTPVLAWKAMFSGPFYSTPVIDGDKVYIGNNDSILYCLDIVSGRRIWQFSAGGQVRSTVCADPTRVFLIGGNGSLYCLNKEKGTLNWEFGTGGERLYDQYDYFQSAPILRDDTLYFGSGDSNVYAINAGDGHLIWKYHTGNVVHGVPALYNDKLYIGSFDGNVYALHTRDGSLAWTFKSVGHQYFPKGEMQFSPKVIGGMVFIGGRDYNLYAIDAERGYCHWNKAFPGGWAPATTPANHDSTVLVGASDDKILLLLRTKDGKEIWRSDVKYNVFGSSPLTAGMCYTTTLMGKLFGIDLQTGRIRWTYTTEKYAQNKALYFKPDDTYRDDIHSIIHSQEEFLAALFNIGAIYSAPAIDKDHIVFSSTEGVLYCLQRG